MKVGLVLRPQASSGTQPLQPSFTSPAATSQDLTSGPEVTCVQQWAPSLTLQRLLCILGEREPRSH